MLKCHGVSPLRASIFTKLMAISLSMVFVIMLAVGSFFFVIVRPLWQGLSPERYAELRSAHDHMIIALLLLLGLIVLGGHAMLRYMLEPVRRLQQGVMALGDGNLQVVVPVRTRDELGTLTAAFNQMVCRVGDMVRARDQLLLDVSHELRSPLTRMKVALELCANDEHVERLRATVAEMESMVTELLELERLRHGRGLELERQDLMEVVRDAVTAFERGVPGVCLGAAPARVLLDIDADKIRRVLGNLLDNAGKYALADSHPTQVTVSEQDETVTVQISDEGPGIPANDLPNLFEPFFRVDRSRSKRTGGYGLGLSLCKRIVEAHGGTLTVRNNPQRGSSFTITIARK